jgi:CubicO group peptidase (beta-lactamase class C family)
VGATHVACGCARRGAVETGGDVETFFDLASVTKPMTAVAVAKSKVNVAAPLGAYLEVARGTASASVSLELFLAHRAGLEAHLPLYEPLTRGALVDVMGSLRRAADARRDDARGRPPPDGFAPLYSDLGYLLAGVALARYVGARDAGEAIRSLVVRPLGLEDRLGTARDLPGLEERAAPTEVVPWRGGAVVGRVHDENAWAIGGDGGCGHAGEFGTIDAVLAFGQAVLAEREELSWLFRERPGGTLRAGFDGRSKEGSSAGSRMGDRAFGHLGFTGTSLWIDPDAEVVVALLTNRVHPTRDNVAIRAARPEAHDALFTRALSL